METNLNPIYEKYSNSKISANVVYDKSSIKTEDIDIITELTNSKANGHYWKDFYFKDLPFKIKHFFDNLFKPSKKVSDINITVSKDTSKESNSININTKLCYNNLFLSPFDFYYLYRSNSYIAKLNYILYNKRFDSKPKRIDENEMSCGILYNAAKDKKTFFANNDTYLYNDKYKICSSIKFSKNDFLYENGLKLNLIRNLFNKSSFIFRDYLPYDPVNRLTLQVSQKSINNLYKENSLIPEHDSHLRTKLIYEKNSFDVNQFCNNNIKLSSSLIKSLNSLYIKSKFFMRRTFNFETCDYQLNIEGANIKSLTEKEVDDFNLNEKIYINNFRGVTFPSRMDRNGSNINYGNTFYTLIKNKMFFNMLPFFNKFSIEKDGFCVKPFFQFNLLYNPRKDINTSLHMSSGIGLSFISRICAFEFNFLPYVKSNSNELKSRFSFTLGLD